MSLFGFSRNHKTFRPKKKLLTETRGFHLRGRIDATLGSGDLRSAVILPEGEDLCEWLAVNTVDFYNQINLLYGSLSEFCVPEKCPRMTASPKYEYRWADGVTIKRPIECSAPEYVDYLMAWIEDQLEDQAIFPREVGQKFPTNFLAIVKQILRRLFRVYAHVYHSHFEIICTLGEEAHLNTCFKHFVFFVVEFDLIEEKELAPLKDLIDSFVGMSGKKNDVSQSEA